MQMKLVTFFLTVVLVRVEATGFGQKITISEKNAPIEKVFQKIENQTGFVFFYDSEDVKQVNVSISLKNASVEQTLKECLDGSSLAYKMIDNTIVIKKKDIVQRKVPEKPEPIPSVSSNELKISGKVLDDKNEGLPGVSILIKGLSQGTLSDIDGKWQLSVPDASTVLVFSFVGYNSQEVTVGSQSVVNVTLTPDIKGLEELIVVGYGTQKKVNLTGAITAVNATELNSQSASNLSNTLAGRAPGVNVTNTSGLAGASSSIRMRGSFGDPLYVIDGIVRDKEAFDVLEAAEVDQLSFLKDAATASIYGSRAGNGVVMVTTKTGVKQQKPIFTLQSNYTTGRPTQTLLSDLTTAEDELIYQNRVAQFNGTPIPNGQREFDYFKDKRYNVNDFIWQNPSSHRHSLSVSGGDKKLTYYSLLSYRGEKGSYKSLDYNKFNMRTNVTAEITEDIKVNLNVAATQQNHDRFYWPFTGEDDFDVSDLYRVTFNWPKTYPFYTKQDGTPANHVTPYPVQTPMGSWQAWSVIDQVVGDRYIKTRRRNMNSILSVDIKLDKLIPGLSSKIVGNYIAEDYMRKKYLTFQKNYVFNQADANGNRFIPAAPDENKTNIFTFSQNQPFLSQEISTDWSYQFDWFASYTRTFNKHAIDGLIVFEQAQNGGYGVSAKLEDPITSYDQSFVYSTDTERRNGTIYQSIGARQSWIGRFNYNFDSRYIAEFSFRYDGNTLFPETKRWGFFPSVSAAWRLSEEKFLRDKVSFLDELKLRASYGTTGNDLNVNNDKISAFSYNYLYQNSGSYMFGDKLYQSIAPGATPNRNLTWATSTTYNVGLDFGLLKNRLYGTLDMFLKKEKNILGSRLVTLPDNYGQSLAPENYAARSWRGGELFVEWRDKAIDNKVNYSINGNVGFAIDRWDIIDQGAAYQPGGNRFFQSQIGHPANRIIGLKTVGMVRTQDQLDALLESGLTQFGRKPYLGGLYFEDVRGDGYAEGPDGKIDGNDIQVLSNNATPRINYGFGLNVSYKGLSINSHFQGVGAYDRIISNQEGPGMRQHGGTVRPYYPIWASDVWTPENTNAKYPRPIGQNWYESGSEASSFWIRNGAYLRLKTLNIAYNIPKSWASKLKLASAQIYVNGTNLFSVSKVKEFHDPEQLNYDSFPVMKTFTMGLDFKF